MGRYISAPIRLMRAIRLARSASLLEARDVVRPADDDEGEGEGGGGAAPGPGEGEGDDGGEGGHGMRHVEEDDLAPDQMECRVEEQKADRGDVNVAAWRAGRGDDTERSESAEARRGDHAADAERQERRRIIVDDGRRVWRQIIVAAKLGARRDDRVDQEGCDTIR